MKHSLNLVFWNEKKVRWELEVIGADEEDRYNPLSNVLSQPKGFAIIGNKFKNPELLRK